jgi:hypothetical protein
VTSQVELLARACACTGGILANVTSVFAPEIHVSPKAPAADRLAGFLGRDPNWHAGQ